MKDDILHESRSGELIAYLILENPDSVFVPDTQVSSTITESNLFNRNREMIFAKNLYCVKSTREDINLATSDNILNEIENFKKFQADVDSKLCLFEDSIGSGIMVSKEKLNDNTSGVIFNTLKATNSSLESELKLKDPIIEYLTMPLLSWDSNNSPIKSDECNLHKALNDKPIDHNKYEFSGNRGIITISEQKSRFRWKFNAEWTTPERFVQESL